MQHVKNSQTVKIAIQNLTNKVKKNPSNFHNHDVQNRVSCNGSKEGSLHPLIYLSLAKTNNVTCPYCGKVFSKTISNKTGDGEF